MLVFKASTHAVLGLCFTPDERGLATGSAAGVAVWDVTAAPTVARQFNVGSWLACPVAVSPCGRFFACCGDFVRVFDLTAPDDEPIFVTDGVQTHAFAPDGVEFATPAYFPRQWAVPAWEPIRSGAAAGSDADGRQRYCTGAIAYTPDGKFLAVSFAVMAGSGRRYDWAVRLFDRATGAHTRDLPAEFGYAAPTQIAFRPDGEMVAGNFGPVLGAVSVADGTEIARIKAGTKHITAIAFTPDGSKLVAVSNDTRVRVYDARTWAETTGYEWQVGKLRSVAVAPDGLRMAAGSGTGKVVIWDVDG